MRRRELMALVGGVGFTWPLAAPAQQPTMPAIPPTLLTRADEVIE